MMFQYEIPGGMVVSADTVAGAGCKTDEFLFCDRGGRFCINALTGPHPKNFYDLRPLSPQRQWLRLTSWRADPAASPVDEKAGREYSGETETIFFPETGK
jgi:hypothetical protein